MVHFAPGDAVPLKLETDLPFATLEAGENLVRFDRDVYLYVAPGAFLVSPDAQRWAEAGTSTLSRSRSGPPPAPSGSASAPVPANRLPSRCPSGLQ